GDLLATADSDDSPIARAASTSVVTVTPETTLLDVLDRLLDEDIEHLPIVDTAGRLVGICTRTDILRGRARHLDHDPRQPGWPRIDSLGGRAGPLDPDRRQPGWPLVGVRRLGGRAGERAGRSAACDAAKCDPAGP